jgi:hypothetical protein
LGTIKINIDGFFIQDTGLASVGLLAGNHAGDVLFVAARQNQNCRDMDEAELHALKDRMHLALDWTAGPMIFEADFANMLC